VTLFSLIFFSCLLCSSSGGIRLVNNSDTALHEFVLFRQILLWVQYYVVTVQYRIVSDRIV